MSVVVENLTKSFGPMKAIDDLSVAFQEHSISVLLGPSGCGKTTVLRSIAGLEAPNCGTITIQGNWCSPPHAGSTCHRKSVGWEWFFNHMQSGRI